MLTPAIPTGNIAVPVSGFSPPPLGMAACGIGGFSGTGAAAGAFSVVGVSGIAVPSVHLLRRRERRREDFRIRAATTQVAAARVLHVVERRLLVALKQVGARHD